MHAGESSPLSIGREGRLHWLRDAREALISCYANPCGSLLFTRVPLPGWPNQAANEPHYFGPIDHT